MEKGDKTFATENQAINANANRSETFEIDKNGCDERKKEMQMWHEWN